MAVRQIWQSDCSAIRRVVVHARHRSRGLCIQPALDHLCQINRWRGSGTYELCCADMGWGMCVCVLALELDTY